MIALGRIAIVTVAAAVIAGCSAKSMTPMLPGSGDAVGADQRQSRLPVTLHLVIPGPHRHRQRGSNQLRPRFVSASTNGVLVQVYPHGAAQTPANLITQGAVDVSSGSAACDGMKGYPRSCTASIGTPPTANGASDDFVVTTYDTAPSHGKIPDAANLLAVGNASGQTITLGKQNAFTVFLGGVVASLNAPAFTSMPADGATHTMTIAIDPEDFGNNPITAGTHDPFANPVSITLTESGGSGHANLTLNNGAPATHVTVSHSSDSVVLSYDGVALNGYNMALSLHAAAVRGTGGASESVNVSPLTLSGGSEFTPTNGASLALNGNGDMQNITVSEAEAPNSQQYYTSGANCAAIADASGVVGSGTGGTFHVFARGMISTPPPLSGCVISVTDSTSTVKVSVTNSYSGILGTPTISEFSTGLTAASGPVGITVGPDGAMWFAQCAATQVGRIPATGSSPTVAEYSTPSSGYPQNLWPGIDGNLWFSESTGSNHYLAKISTRGSGTAYSVDNAPYQLATDSSGQMWFTVQGGPSEIGTIGVNGGATYYTSGLTSGSNPRGITLGPDGNLWFAEFSADKIGKITTAGVITEFTIPAQACSCALNPLDITAGPDGDLYFTLYGGDLIGKIPTTASTNDPNDDITVFSSKTLQYYNPSHITTGPDGALWFTEEGPLNGSNDVGRITTDGATLNEYYLGSSKAPFGISSGPDGAIWFTEFCAGKIGRVSIQTSSALKPRASHRTRFAARDSR